ncbi:hypothetical protein NDU88_010304 [Pleurodeles waltl]|uniref:Uncharacterized protein n=1 Tax=Pleurodeles waltl TaxID=8319 RepID=A0AAV7PYF6_PLEWA|nr:hypothetical protein NDU88_010304 [Pleurodeles waltl]
MARRPDLTSPAQLRGSTKITLPKTVGVHRSLRDHAKAQLPAATRNYGPLLSPTRRTAGQTKQSFKRWGAQLRSQGTGSPPSTRAPAGEAPPFTAKSAGLQKHRSLLRRHNHPAPGPSAHSGHQGAPGRLLDPQTPEPRLPRAPREKARLVAPAVPQAAPRPRLDYRAEPRSSR